MISAEDIIERLKKSFHTPSRKDEKLKVVVLCIVISTTFWFFSALNKEDYISQVNYPVEIVFDETGYIATTELPNRIPLEVTGGGWDLMTRSFGFNMNPIRIRLNRPDESNFVLTSTLRSRLTPELDPVVVNYVLKDSLVFDIQKRVSREFELTLDTTSISFDSDFRMASQVVLEPRTITWTGPEKIINSLDRLIYVKADLSEIDEDVDEALDIPEPPALITTEVESTQLSFEVVRLMDVQTELNVRMVNFPDSLWSVNPTIINARYRIEELKFDVTDTTAIDVYADYDELDPLDSSIVLQTTLNNAFIEGLELSVTKVKASKNE